MLNKKRTRFESDLEKLKQPIIKRKIFLNKLYRKKEENII